MLRFTPYSWNDCKFTHFISLAMKGFQIDSLQMYLQVNWIVPFNKISQFFPLWLELAMGLDNLPAVRVQTTTMVSFGFRPVEEPGVLPLGVPNPYLYLSTDRFCWVYLDLCVPISGSPFRVVLYMVAFRYHTVNRNILTLVHHCLFLMLWPPV